eukprot:1513442-Amphidinium_carterae.1
METKPVGRIKRCFGQEPCGSSCQGLRATCQGSSAASALQLHTCTLLLVSSLKSQPPFSSSASSFSLQRMQGELEFRVLPSALLQL